MSKWLSHRGRANKSRPHFVFDCRCLPLSQPIKPGGEQQRPDRRIDRGEMTNLREVPPPSELSEPAKAAAQTSERCRKQTKPNACNSLLQQRQNNEAKALNSRPLSASSSPLLHTSNMTRHRSHSTRFRAQIAQTCHTINRSPHEDYPSGQLELFRQLTQPPPTRPPHNQSWHLSSHRS